MFVIVKVVPDCARPLVSDIGSALLSPTVEDASAAKLMFKVPVLITLYSADLDDTVNIAKVLPIDNIVTPKIDNKVSISCLLPIFVNAISR